jgi:hypothetical protein
MGQLILGATTVQHLPTKSQRLSPGVNEPPVHITKSRTRTPIPPNSAERHIGARYALARPVRVTKAE